MIEEIVITVLWAIITFMMLVCGSISLEYAYLGMCIMLAAGLLHKGE